MKDVVAVRANRPKILPWVEFIFGPSRRNRGYVVNVDSSSESRTVPFAEIELADEASRPKLL